MLPVCKQIVQKAQIGAILCSLTMSSCYSTSQYEGDGVLVDAGRGAAKDRYVLDLGAIEFGTSSEKTFRMRNLPPEEFVVGFRINKGSDRPEDVQKTLEATHVALRLEQVGGGEVFATDGVLADWNWSVPVVGNELFVFRYDSPGTYFSPSASAEYRLTLRISPPKASPGRYVARLLVKSGGWK